jgi:hypothetical protein
MPGDLVRVHVIGGEEDTTRVLHALSEDPSFTEQFTPVPTVETEPGGTFGIVDVMQDFIVGSGVELTGAAVTAAVHRVVARIRKRRGRTESGDGQIAGDDDTDEAQGIDGQISVAVQGEGVAEVVVRLRPNG